MTCQFFVRGTDWQKLDLSDVNDSFRLEIAETPLIFAHVCLGKSLEWTAGTLVELPSKTAGCLSEKETQNGQKRRFWGHKGGSSGKGSNEEGNEKSKWRWLNHQF